MAVVVEDLHHRTDDRPAHGARLLQPPAWGGDGRRAFGAAVGLVDHRSEPLHHPPLHVDRAGRAGVEDALDRRHVQRARTSSGSASSRTNMVGTIWVLVTWWRSTNSRHCSGVHWRMMTAVWPAWSAFVMPTNGPRVVHRPAHERARRGRWRCRSPGRLPRQPCRRGRRDHPRQGSADALGPAGRARGVHHLQARAAGRLRSAAPTVQVGEGAKAVDVADGEAVLGVDTGLGGPGATQVGEVLVPDQHLGFGVRHHECGFGRSEVRN